MDLGTVRERLEAGHYMNTVQWYADLTMPFKAADHYWTHWLTVNPSPRDEEAMLAETAHYVLQTAKTLSEFVAGRVSKSAALASVLVDQMQT